MSVKQPLLVILKSVGEARHLSDDPVTWWIAGLTGWRVLHEIQSGIGRVITRRGGQEPNVTDSKAENKLQMKKKLKYRMLFKKWLLARLHNWLPWIALAWHRKTIHKALCAEQNRLIFRDSKLITSLSLFACVCNAGDVCRRLFFWESESICAPGFGRVPLGMDS